MRYRSSSSPAKWSFTSWSRWIRQVAYGSLTSLFLVASVSAQMLSVLETEDQITIQQNGKVVLTYNKVSPQAPAGIDPVYERSGCLHPVRSPLGRSVTAMFPQDHAHQHGVFTAWVKTQYDGQTVDFWNLAKKSGRVLHEQVRSTFADAESAGLEVDLLHRIETNPPRDVLRERWKITVLPTDGTYHCFDLATTQTALTDLPLTVDKYHYGGVALRGPARWLTAADGSIRSQPDLEREPSGFLNDLGSQRIAGNHQHAKWVALWGEVRSQPVYVAILCHAENFRAPQAARLHPTKPYCCFSPCVDGSFVIDRQHPYAGRYRFLVADTAPDAAWIDQQWEQWCGH